MLHAVLPSYQDTFMAATQQIGTWKGWKLLLFVVKTGRELPEMDEEA
jgi:glucose-6-phosphate 1-dehydrogenase